MRATCVDCGKELGYYREKEIRCRDCYFAYRRINPIIREPQSEEMKLRISASLKGRKLSQETIENMRGRTPWNKGKVGECEQLRGNKASLGREPWNKGKKHEAVAGDKNPNWKGGKPRCRDCGNELANRKAKRCYQCQKSFEKANRKPLQERYSFEYKAWRKKAMERDWFTCQMPGCGYKGKKIEVHHILRWKDNETVRFDPNNGITLCANCHLSIRNREDEYVKLFSEVVISKVRLEFNYP